MEFYNDIKQEIIQKELSDNASKSAFLAGIFKVLGSVHIAKGCVNLQLDIEDCTLATQVVLYLKQIYNAPFEVSFGKSKPDKERLYTIDVMPNLTEKIASNLYCIEYQDNVAVRFIDGIEYPFSNIDQKIAYLRAIFLALGKVYVPRKEEKNSGYHFEMIFTHEKLAEDVANLFKGFNINVKILERNEGETYNVYLKESEAICDLCALLGASEAVLSLNNIIIERQMTNMANRQTNCSMANISKIVEAGQKQLMAINFIEKIVGLDCLDDKLKEIALIRKENPDFSLEQIAEEMENPIGKSGINHRFRKLMELAESLEKRGTNGRN
ncbi:MAG: DNA-binding protein WhiA [Clostridia bacterium]